MAQSSSSYDSHLNLTSGLLSQLDLNPSQNQYMEDMDIDQVIDVPDTPDRLAARNTNGDERVERESKTSVGGDSGNSNFLDVGVINRTRGRSGLISQNGQYKGLYFRSNKNFNDLEATERRIHQSESLSAPRDTHINRRMIPDKTSKNVTKHSIGDQHIDKGKGLCNKSLMKSSTFQEGNADIDSKEQNGNGYTRILRKDFPHRVFKNPLAEEITEGSISRNGLHCMPNSLNPTVTYHKGKEVAGDDRGSGSVIDHGKAVNSTSEFQPKIGKSVSSPLHSSTPLRVFGNKRLVRNGCISPHNIAKASAGQSSGGSKDAGHNDTGNLVPSSPSCLLDIRDLNAEGNNHSKAKGKGIIVHSCIARETDARTEHFFNSSSVVHNEEANGASDVNENASGSFEGLGGWRSTRNRSKKEYPPFSDEGVGLNLQRETRVDRRVNRSGDYSRTQYDNPEVQVTNSSQHGSAPPLAQTAASLVSESDLANGRRHRVTNSLIKRQKKHGSNLTNHGAYSASHFNDSEIMFLGSSGESSNSRLTRNRSRHGRSLLDPVIEIDELSPKVGPSGSQHMGPRTNDDDSNARARQVEADEILARELQEQLYQEGPTSRGDEIDAHLAWTLQQEGSPNASSTGSHHALHPSASSISALYRRSRSRSLQNPSSRRGLQARVSNSARMAQLRSHFHNQPLSILPRERNLFPSDMDLDMRLDILEALEAAVGGLSDMRRGHHINQFQRDFNENDYEMLLSLDENNHQHGGASVDQINRLPQSTVQTDNFEEACAICLETPTSGDTIRHLPCLHKFHKDCIDPWLSRKTSCPICKSSIT